jgi:hypothetical protein
MKPFMFILVLVACLLAACGQNTQAPTPLDEEIPLLTDADIDKAQLQVSSEVIKLVGSEEGLALKGREVPALADGQSELSTQAVLPNASGYVYYAQFNQTPVVGTVPYSLYSHYQGFDSRTLIYSGFRQIQSVAGSLLDFNSFSVVVSMRETTSPTSDFEIFLIMFGEFGEESTVQLTSDSVDNINVSMTADASRIVYEESVSGGATVVLRTRQAFASYNTAYLINPSPQSHPSISSSGDYITLVRDQLSGNDSIQRYIIPSNTYLTVASSTSLTNTFDFPSISGDGLKVLWLQNSTVQPREVKLRNLSTGTLQTVATGTTIQHPFLTADGRFMTYQEGRNIVTKDLITAQVQTLTNSLSRFISFYSPMWQMFYQPVRQLSVNIKGLPTTVFGQVRVTGPNGFYSGLFGRSRTFSNLTAGTYTITAIPFATAWGKPTCRFYNPIPATQQQTVTAGQPKTATVTYTWSPCPPD